MNNIGIGIMCFGDVSYFNSTKEKVTNLKDIGIDCYVLTDEPEQFTSSSNWDNSEYSCIKIIKYNRHLKSYHDKIILVKEILKYHNISILIDADTFISNYFFIEQLVNYKFKDGITYIDNLLSNKVNKEFIGEINLTAPDWDEYKKYVDKLLPTFTELETINEYFIVFNNQGFKDDFFLQYEKLQVMRESCDIRRVKEIYAGGEGVSIHIASKLSNVDIQKDNELFNMLKDNVINVVKH
jgi:hypothetical protein